MHFHMAAIGKLEQELRFDAVVFHFTVHAEKDVMKDFSIVPQMMQEKRMKHVLYML